MFGAGAETRSALASKRPGLSDARDINAAKRLSIDRKGKTWITYELAAAPVQEPILAFKIGSFIVFTRRLFS